MPPPPTRDNLQNKDFLLKSSYCPWNSYSGTLSSSNYTTNLFYQLTIITMRNSYFALLGWFHVSRGWNNIWKQWIGFKILFCSLPTWNQKHNYTFVNIWCDCNHSKCLTNYSYVLSSLECKISHPNSNNVSVLIPNESCILTIFIYPMHLSPLKFPSPLIPILLNYQSLNQLLLGCLLKNLLVLKYILPWVLPYFHLQGGSNLISCWRGPTGPTLEDR